MKEREKRRRLGAARKSSAVSIAHKMSAKPTAEAIFAVAVMEFQLEQRLRVGRMPSGEAGFLPSPNGGVAFRSELFQPFECSFGALVVMVRAGVGKESRNNSVDEQKVDRIARKTRNLPAVC